MIYEVRGEGEEGGGHGGGGGGVRGYSKRLECALVGCWHVEQGSVDLELEAFVYRSGKRLGVCQLQERAPGTIVLAGVALQGSPEALQNAWFLSCL